MAIDLGTSTLKVAVFDLDGSEVSFESIEYPLAYPGKDLIENDLEKYWGAVVKLIKNALGRLNDDPSRILALSLSSQGETIVPVDKKCRPLRPAVVWLDNRSGREAAEKSKADKIITLNKDDFIRISPGLLDKISEP